MGIRVRPGAAEAVVASPDRFAVQVEGADDVAAALAALRLVRVELVGLSGQGRRPAGETGRDGGPVSHADVSPAVYGPAGPLLLVQHLGAAPADLERIPELVASRLAEAGVESATVTVPEPGGVLDGVERAAGAVVLRLFPGTDPGAAMPGRWLDVAVDWLVADLDRDATVATRILGIEHAVAPRRVADLFHDCGLARTWCDMVSGDPADRFRTASLTFGRLPHLALGAGGPGVDRAGLVARFELLRELGREVAGDVGYACLDVEPDFGGLGAGLPATGWQARGGASPNRVAAAALGVVVPDAFPWQVLTAAHWTRLVASGEVPPATELGGGRREVAFGDPAAWLPNSGARDEALTAAIDWLAPILVDDGELDGLGVGGTVAAAPAAGDGLPDLDGIDLRPAPTPRRSTRLSPLELAAWWGHEPHSDAPSRVSPVLARFVGVWAAGLDDGARQRLKPLVPRLVGTDDPSADGGRRWAAVDWLVRTHARRWLEAAGEVRAARRLGALGFLGDREALGAAVDLLATYLARCPAVDADGVGAGDEAWESVREAAAWAAAAEAATEGSTAGVADAAALLVLETSRRSGPAPDVPAAVEWLVEDAWQAAIRAVAADAWEDGWRAADRVARERSGLTIRVEMGRVAKSPRPGRTDDVDALALEQADRAARAALAEIVAELGAADRDATVDPEAPAAPDAADARDAPHPWDAAITAARRSPGGVAWFVVVDGSRIAVGEPVWAEAMAAARAAVDARLPGGADAAARAVAVALAGEAASRAARSLPPATITNVAAELVEAAFGFLEPLLLPAPPTVEPSPEPEP